MYCSLLRIQFTSSTQIKPSHMAFGRTINIFFLLTYLLTSVVSSLMMLWWLMKGCMGQRFATSVMLLFGLQNLCMWKKLGVSWN